MYLAQGLQVSDIADVQDAALAIPVLSYFGILVVGAVLMIRVYDPAASLLAVALLAVSYPLRSVSTIAWSESSGILLSLLSLLSLVKLPADRLRLGIVAFAGVTAGLAYATRYALIVCLPVGVLLILNRDAIRQSLLRITVFSAAFASVMAPVLLHNWMSTGLLSGPARLPSPIPLSEHAAQSLRVLFGQYASRRLNLAQVALLLVSVLAAALWAWSRRENIPSLLRNVFVVEARHRLYLWPVFYVTTFVLVSLKHDYLEINARLMAPAAPFVAFGWAAFLSRAFRPRLALAAFLAVGALASSLAGDLRAIVETKPHNIRRVIRDSSRLIWVRDETGPNDLIVGDGVHDLMLHFGRRVLYLGPFPQADPLTRGRLCVLLAETGCGRYQNIYLVLKDRGRSGETGRVEVGPFWSDLLRGGQTPDRNLTFVARLEDAVVYRWECQACGGS